MVKLLVIPDTHVPYHDKAALDLIHRVVHQARPDRLVLIGDFADFYAVSHFTKDPGRRADLQYEIGRVNEELDRIGAHDLPVTYLEGNHELRLERYLAAKAPELFGLVHCRELFQIAKRGWKWVPYHSHFQIGKVLFAHDLGHAGKYAALNTLAAAGKCTVFGHTHRGAVMYGGTVDGEHRFSLNVGWLGDAAQIDYMHRAKTRDWQTGFGGIAMDPCGHPDAPIQADDPVYGRTGGQIDGLEIPWPQRTYANPPFNELKAWLKKAAREACRMQVSGYTPDVMLLAPVRTHRVWFWDLGMVSSMAWLKPVKFHGHKQAFPAPLVMLYWGLRYSEFRDAFSELSTKVDR